MMIPSVMINRLGVETHEQYRYVGVYKTYAILKENCVIQNMYRNIKRIVKFAKNLKSIISRLRDQ